jgi:hypothetical protein
MRATLANALALEEQAAERVWQGPHKPVNACTNKPKE